MDNVMERINSIEKRLEKLEKIEKRRKTFAIIKIMIYLAIIAGIIAFGFYAYNRIIDTIAPYQEIIDKYNDSKDIFSNFMK